MSTLLVGPALRDRVRHAGADPLLTYYEPAAGVRVELSATTFANWVDKTSNLLVDEELLEPGDVVALDLALTAPGHWMTAVWQVACWQVGLVVAVDAERDPRLVVTGPDASATAPGDVDVLACSLHPFGLDLAEVPAGIRDYAAEVRGQADQHVPGPVPASAPAWADPDRTLNQAELVDGLPLAPHRRLVRPSDPWTTARDGVVSALVSGGSYVVVVGGSAEQVAHLASTERVSSGP